MKSLFWRVINWFEVGHVHDPFMAIGGMCYCHSCQPRKPGELGHKL